MSTSNLIKKLISTSIIASQALATTAFASTVNVHSFTPAANPSYMLSEDALLHHSWGERNERPVFFSVFYDMVNDPLVELNEQHTERRAVLVDSINSLNLAIAYSFLPRLQFGVSTTMSLVQLPEAAQQFAFSDSRIFSKLRINNESDVVSFAVMPELFIPTGNRSLFLSNNGVGAGIRLIAEHDFKVIQATANVGYRYAPDATYRDLNMRSIIPASLGIVKPLGSRWALNADLSGDITLPLNSYTNPSQFYLGAKYRISQDFIATAGGSIGAFNERSSANYQVIAGLTMMPSAAKAPEPIPFQRVEPVVVVPPPVVVSAVAKPKPRVVFTPKELLISEEVKFMHGKAMLTSEGEDLLNEVARVMKDNAASYKQIIIEGHTNEIGSTPYNQKLSQARASVVREYLQSHGADAKALVAVGYGESRPKILPTDPMPRQARLAANRRVAFKVVQN